MKDKFIGFIFLSGLTFGHQPVMDMAPRWSGGYGFQVRYESFGSDQQINNENSYSQRTYWLEGVYTWDRAKRITFKLPYHSIEKHDADVTTIDKSIGDLILALPLKKYSNFKRRTQNFGFTPQLRLPTSSTKTDDHGFLGGGISLSYSSESFSFYQFYDVFGWLYDEKDPLLGLDINLGIHPYHNNATNSGLFLLWDLTGRWMKGTTTILSGPVIMPYYQNIMARLEVKFPVVENDEESGLSQGITINTGIGFVF